MLVDEDAAFGKRDTQMRGLDLKDETFKGDGVVVADGAFLLGGENQIKIDVMLDGDKGRAGLLGIDSEAPVKLADVNFFQETIGLLFGFNAMQTEFIAESALKGFIDAFAAAPGFWGISGNGTGTQLGEGTSNLSEVAFLDRAAGLGSEEEMTGSVRIQGAEDAVTGDTVSEEAHTTQGIFFFDEFHVIDFTGSVVHQDE